jgi:hypothetical protein
MPADAVSERLEAFLKRHGYTGRKRRKRAARAAGQRAEGRVDELEMPRQQIVLALVSVLEPIVAGISELASDPPRPRSAPRLASNRVRDTAGFAGRFRSRRERAA